MFRHTSWTSVITWVGHLTVLVAVNPDLEGLLSV